MKKLTLFLLAISSPLFTQEVGNHEILTNEDGTTVYVCDEVELIQESRGMMQQARGVIVTATPFNDAEIAPYINAGGYGGFHYQVKMKNGDFKGEILDVDFILYSDDLFVRSYEVGDKILLGYLTDSSGNALQPGIYGQDRLTPLIILIILFIAGVLALGRKQGIMALLALSITVLLIFLIFIPRVMAGASPLFWAVVVSIIATGLTFIVLGGFTKKSLAAFSGSIIGFVLSGILVLIFGAALKVDGIMDSNLVWITYSTDLDISGLIFSGILIGAVGAVMDVAISVASAVEELHMANPELGWRELFRSAMNVGTDMMGTMVNTLILAYVGASLPFIVLIYLQYTGTSVADILNLEAVAREILRSIIGSLGMFATIPATAYLASILKPIEKSK